MSNNDYVVAFVIATFAVFILSLAWVTWWSNQKPKSATRLAESSVRMPRRGHGELTTR